MGSNSCITRQPGKAIFTVFATVFIIMRLPIWMLYFASSTLRQNPYWTYKQALLVRIMRAVLEIISLTEMKTAVHLLPHDEGDRFVTINPANSEMYVGAVAQDSEIYPKTIGGTWYPSCPVTVSEVSGVVLHFHGGAYVLGNGRTQETSFAANTILNNTSATHVFCPQYRLASHPGGRFPAALQDAVTALLYLTETLSIPASRIIASGDSAGGNLCLALLRYITDNPGKKLPNPSCAWLWSSWIDPQVYLMNHGFQKYPNIPTDIVNERLGVWGARAMAPSEASGVTLAHPNICFAGAAFETPTPLFFSVGECEALYHDNLRAFNEFRAVPGNKVELQVELKAVHDILAIGPMVGFEKEAALAAKRAEKFLQSCR